MPLTCIGVPDSKMRRLHERAANAYASEMFINLFIKRTIKQNVLEKRIYSCHTRFVNVWSFFNLCASSHMRRSHDSLWLNFDECIRKVSYETIRTWGETHWINTYFPRQFQISSPHVFYLQSASRTCETIKSRDNIISTVLTESYKLNSFSNPFFYFSLPIAY